mgnify:CR=1 FL=1
MGFWSDILSRNPTPVAAMTPRVEYIGGREELAEYYSQGGVDMASPSSLWRTQPHLRTVVSFLARNTAQLGVHVFERLDETDRKRDRTSPVALSLQFPDAMMTTYDLIYALVGDLMLYDRAYWLVLPTPGERSPFTLRRLPPSWVERVPGDPFKVAEYTVSLDGRSVTVPASQILDFTGYSPSRPVGGSPTVEALRATLQEQVEAAKYRGQVWKRGGRVSAVLQRPKDAPQWSDAAREAFREDWYAKYTGNGSRAGGTPLLEDGMTLQRIDFNAQEQQFVEAAKLSLTTVAAAFHVNPTMIGQNDGANYSNVREFRRMLYGDTLGPLLAQIEARLNTFLIPMLGVDPTRFYVEFNIREKLEGSFDEQASALQKLIGGPMMTRAEGRARLNLPFIEGADELIVPLNVVEGGQASPTDSGSQNEKPKMAVSRMKARRTRVKAVDEAHAASVEDVVKAAFKRQEKAVRSRLGAKADAEWWDADRWDAELADDLQAVALEVTQDVAASTLKKIGLPPKEYDVERTRAWLEAVCSSSASSINEATRSKIEAALEADDSPAALDSTFEAQDSRASTVATTFTTTMTGFAAVESVKQVDGEGSATKTWVTGPNPRPEHARMDGETVPLSENFSNSAAWPGDGANLGADDLANCNCSLSIQWGS